jgi:hypothetical protein
MSKTRNILRTLVVLGVVGGLLALGAFSVFSDQVDNDNNRVTAGTVALTENGTGSAMYSMTNAKPGDSQTSCIKVTYDGSLAADVHLYTPSTIGSLGANVDLKIETGSFTGSGGEPTFPACAVSGGQSFTADGSPLFDDLLSDFPTAYGSLADYPGSESSWDDDESVVYRVTGTLRSDTPNSKQGADTGLHTLRWEAQSQ